MRDFRRFYGTSIFPNTKKKSKLQWFWEDFMKWYNCRRKKHDFIRCYIDNIEYRYCANCPHTERSVIGAWIRVERPHVENLEDLKIL
jgi:hypothetical protein